MNISQLFVKTCSYYTDPVTRGSPNPKYQRLAARLRRVRKAAKLTRSALEQQAGGTNGAILYIETDQRIPTVATVERIAAALGVSAAWLAYGVGEQDDAGLPSASDGMGTRLYSVRTALQVSRAELARRAELSPRAIGKIEAGGQSGIDVIESLARELRISPGWLAFNEGPQHFPRSRRGRPPAQSAAHVG